MKQFLYIFSITPTRSNEDDFSTILVAARDTREALRHLWDKKYYGVGVSNYSVQCIGSREASGMQPDRDDPCVLLWGHAIVGRVTL